MSERLKYDALLSKTLALTKMRARKKCKKRKHFPTDFESNTLLSWKDKNDI